MTMTEWSVTIDAGARSHTNHEHSCEGHHNHGDHHQHNNYNHSLIPNGLPKPAGIIFPFTRVQNNMFGQIAGELRNMASEKKARLIFAFIMMNIVTLLVLMAWNLSTNSMGLTAYMHLVIFDLLALLTCLMSVWVERQTATPIFSFGYQRFEVLAVFSSTMLAALGSFFIVKEGTERLFEQPEVHTGRMLPGAMVVFMYHQLVTYVLTSSNRAYNHVISASSSSWLQEHVADMCEGLCHVVPGLSKVLLPRINPFLLLGFAGGLAVCVTHLLIDLYAYHTTDTVTAMIIAFMTLGTMFPMAAYSGKILLQTTPSHVIGQLDKCIREASTLDGVLEFKNEHFWTLSFGKLAGSLHVRVRRDADEQMVLAHVTNRLSNLVQELTVQVMKDDWTTRTSVYQMLANSGYNTKPSPQTLKAREGSPISMYRPLTPITANINSPTFGGSAAKTEFANPFTADFRSAPLVPNIAPSPRGLSPRTSTPNLQAYGSLAPSRPYYNPTALAYANSIASRLPSISSTKSK